jgi:hypothetical protein
MKRIGTVTVVTLVMLVTATILLLYSKQIKSTMATSPSSQQDSHVIMGHMTNQTERLYTLIEGNILLLKHLSFQ